MKRITQLNKHLRLDVLVSFALVSCSPSLTGEFTEEAVPSACTIGSLQDGICPGDGEHRVFIGDTYVISGNLGGLSGADAICMERAAEGSLALTYVAILSSTNTSALSRLTLNSGALYQLSSASTRIIVLGSSTNLWGGSLTQGIAYDSAMTLRTGYVWSGTNPSGTSLGSNCSSWTTGSEPAPEIPATGSLGEIGKVSSKWIQSTLTSACNTSLPIYCISQ